MQKYRILGVLALLLVAGCGDSTEPVTTADVAGVWMYHAPDLRGGSATRCASFGVLTITQSGRTFVGSFSNVDVSCVRSDAPIADWVPAQGSVANGQATGRDVAFDFVDARFHHSGTAEVARITGTAALAVGGVTVTGQFTATRQ
jgi:hypothetical protein